MVVLKNMNHSPHVTVKKPKCALLIIDMQYGYNSDMRSVHFGLPRLDALVDLLLFARKHDIPVNFLEYDGAGDTFGNLTQVAPVHTRFVKYDLDGFTNPTFRDAMLGLGDVPLIAGGYSYSACVRETLRSARKNGIEVITSPDLLFYSRYNDRNPPDLREDVDAFYRSETHLAKNVQDVIELVSS